MHLPNLTEKGFLISQTYQNTTLSTVSPTIISYQTPRIPDIPNGPKSDTTWRNRTTQARITKGFSYGVKPRGRRGRNKENIA